MPGNYGRLTAADLEDLRAGGISRPFSLTNDELPSQAELLERDEQFQRDCESWKSPMRSSADSVQKFAEHKRRMEPLAGFPGIYKRILTV
jgi:hypothetical protein